ncbi:sensor histidine kinase/response regulator Fos-1/TcsA [Aspergillus chevalieri]|uniref:histidine kinase n=1 Tax=Aspergillus chevalieri TaxID=182096 RepID=A0A7R7ZTW6_ASPCH|nr:uncharacterized protein ACHE_80797S [Aspergillus chevalieri]BCR92897.1 hypothetical protein ACHE_80797S [Aspergillus chevalieri]
MVPNNQLLRLTIGNREPVTVAMATPPPEEDLYLGKRHEEDYEEAHREQHEKDYSSRTHECLTRRRDDPLARIYRLTPIPTILLDASLRVVEVSNSHLEIFQKCRDALLDKCIYEISSYAIPSPDIVTLSGALQAAVTSRDVQTIGGIHLPDTNSYFSLRLIPIFDGPELIYMVLEIQNATTEHAESRACSKQTYINESYRTLLDTVKDYAIFMLDTRGNITTWNSGATVLNGYSADEIIGRHFSIFYSDEDCIRQKPEKELEVCLRDGKVEDEGWRYRRDGSRFWANVLVTPIHQFGHHVGFAKVTRDLTERKAAEARLIAAFEESSKLKSDFLANMSHEIRTPMNGMLLALTMLMSTELNQQQQEYASIIEDSTSILLQVINDVLDYSKLSSGAFSLHSDIVNARTIIDAVVRNCNPLLKPGVELISDLPDDFPQYLKGDPLRFRQVLQNLVGNAVKFTEQGSVKIHTSFSVDEEKRDAYNILTEVIDTGIGVPADSINTLFTPFTRFADSCTKKYQGTGLGLSICKGLAELMNGTVGFRPNPDGRGSIFWVTARMNRTDEVDSARAAGLASEETFDPTEEIRKIAPQKHILLVEDNMVNQMVMRKLLNSVGFERVDVAWDGAQAVRMVKQRPLSYDVVLMDVSMPVLSGLEATSRIRELHIDVPIIALTGNALKGDAETYLANGMNDYLAKPIHRQQLLRMLWKWIV